MSKTRKLHTIMETLFRKQLILQENGEAKLRLCMPAVLLAAVLAPKLCLLAAVLALTLGYRFSVCTGSHADEVVTKVPGTAKPVTTAAE